MRSGDYDVWYRECDHCGYDTGKSSLPKEGNKRCWKCGRHITRDYSFRAIKFKEGTKVIDKYRDVWIVLISNSNSFLCRRLSDNKCDSLDRLHVKEYKK